MTKNNSTSEIGDTYVVVKIYRLLYTWSECGKGVRKGIKN